MTDQNPQCEEVLTIPNDTGYDDGHKGWYVIPGCTPKIHKEYTTNTHKCIPTQKITATGVAFCRWVGGSGPGGDPTKKTTHEDSFWSCAIGDTEYEYEHKAGKKFEMERYL